MLKLVNVTKIYKAKNEMVEALVDVNLSFNDGMNFIIGRSGSGKSTLLNILSGIDTCTSGNIFFYNKEFSKFTGKDLERYRNSFIGFVFQDYNLFDDLTVRDNLELVMSLQNKEIDDKEIKNILKEVNLEGLENRKVCNLSGGQKQRVGIARVLIKKPKIIFADEPTGNLDSETSNQIYEMLKELSKNILVIIVSHDKEAATLYGDRIIELKDGKVFNDTNPQELIEKISNNSFVKSKLPLKYAIKFGFQGFKKRYLRMVLTVILVLSSLMFFSMSYMFHQLSVINSLERSVLESQIEYVMLENKNSPNRYFSYNESKNIIQQYNDVNLGLTTQITEDIRFFDTTNKNFYYDGRNSFDYFIGLNDKISHYYESRLSENSRMPTNKNEILISNYLAECYMRFGYKTVDTTVDYDTSEEKAVRLEINTVEDMIGKKIDFRRANDFVLTIVGIVEYDLSYYEPIKTGELVYEDYLSQNIENAYKLAIFNDLGTAQNYYFRNVYVHDSFFATYFNSYYFKLIMQIPSSDVKLKNIKENLLSDNIIFVSPIIRKYEMLVDSLETFGLISNIASIVFSTFTFILIYNFMKKTIEDDYRKIGILRAIGSKKIDVGKIYLCQNGFWIINMSVLYIGAGFLSAYLGSILTGISPSTFMGKQFLVTKLEFTIPLYLIVFMYITGAILLATITPIIKISFAKITRLLKYER